MSKNQIPFQLFNIIITWFKQINKLVCFALIAGATFLSNEQAPSYFYQRKRWMLGKMSPLMLHNSTLMSKAWFMIDGHKSIM